MSLFYEKSSVVAKYNHIKRAETLCILYIPKIDRKPENPLYTHSRTFQNELSKRSYFTFTVKLVPSPGGPSVKWSVPATRESPPSPNGSQLIASGSFCILGYVDVVQDGKNCEYPATLSLRREMPALLLIACMLPVL